VQPVLALHGWQDNAATFDPLIARLPSSISVLAIDLPGHGKSSHYPAGCMYHYTEDVVTVRRIIRHFKWKDVTIMGHSMGGSYAFLYAAFFPTHLKKILVFDIIRPFALNTEHFVKHGGSLVDQFLDVIANKTDPLEYTREQILDRQFKATEGSVSRLSSEIMLARNTVKSMNGLLRLSRDIRLKYCNFLHTLPHEFLLELASRIECEVLYVKAIPGKYYEKPEYYQQTLNVLETCTKHLTRCEMKGTHHAHLNNPENVPDIVKEFLSTAN
jgi:pimeloyl-ACP methyl ester carboxylesterase